MKSWFTEEEKEREHAKLQSDLKEAHRQSLEEAKNRPPPLIVIAYRSVFDRDPSGWPPWEEA